MPADRFVDVWFRDALTDTIAQVKRIYDYVGMPLAAAASVCMADEKEANRCNKRAAHGYTTSIWLARSSD